ncbi:glycosyltransferase family 4 protein [Patescibacteria group bacterium]|nr:glycosyltransferase family 4 protein [Patescibacteria group bacterium]
MKKRKILMITPYIPRLSHSGGQRSSYYSIKYLAPKNDITLICFSRDEEGVKDVRQYCKKVIVVKRGKTWDLKKIFSTAFSPYPFLVVNYISDDFKKAIQDEIDTHDFDLIHCDCFYPMPNIPKTNIPVVLVDLTIEYAVYQHFVESLKGIKKLLAPILWLDVKKMKFWETYYWKNTHTVVAFGIEDQKIISEVTGRKDVQYFQNGVDQKYIDASVKTKKSKNPSILFGVSNMKWMQNRESVELVLQKYWPKIKSKVPDCQLYIIGRFAPDFFGKYASKDIIVTEADSDGDPKDPQYYYERSWLLLAPMGSGGGTRNKFLEGMTFGLPVITTPEGGMGSIKIKNFQDAIVCPDKEILKNVFKLLEDKEYRQKIGINAKKLIKSNYSFSKCVEGLNQIYENITKK